MRVRYCDFCGLKSSRKWSYKIKNLSHMPHPPVYPSTLARGTRPGQEGGGGGEVSIRRLYRDKKTSRSY